MRRLTIVVAVLAALYSGYWFVGANAAEGAARGALADLNAQNWLVTYRDLNTRGFPSRFDTTVTDLSVVGPQKTVAYAVPFAQLFALSYAPNKIIAALANTHEIRIGSERLTLSTDGLRASASVRPGAALLFRAATVEVGAASLTASSGATTRIASALLAAQQTVGVAQSYDLYAETTGLSLPDPVMFVLSPQGDLPATLPRIALDLTVAFDSPIDRRAVTGAGPRIESIELKSSEILWGDMSLSAQGELSVDSNGYLAGTITLTATEWEHILGLAVNAGTVDPGVAPTWQNMGTALSNGSATLELPLRFQAGIMTLGVWPLGAAPKLR